ncbi:DNA recombination protein RmuC [Acinetobacter sp. AG3]|jgi:DNA recombination protein RmuC|uniref:DNA recombination protein RmuC n=1 Tax=unclassified Acinetobacter TaxID=196816 RepID=UPI001EEF941B|nr:DNA recombination protein RmuC [Acinetobacter sp. AG3]MCG7220572.1 DNA recombination protein RmuC [Acinetobacter sp. AG3]
MENIQIIILVAIIIVAILQILLLLKKSGKFNTDDILSPMSQSFERIERFTSNELGKSREESSQQSRFNREELGGTVKAELLTYAQTMRESLKQISDEQTKHLNAFVEQINSLNRSQTQQAELLRNKIEEKLINLQKDNSEQLEKMRQTVDEKLQGTLEKRLSESFKLISERLESVHKGLGEMQVLASGVGDLKKVLTNVKTRGTWGEVQLGAMLEQVLTIDQYEANVSTKGNAERVEYAVKIPSKNSDQEIVWLPIDAKFPMESYSRLIEAQDNADAVGVESALKELELRIKQSANDISRKYISPPSTTDFAILYLPTEGLFAEVTKRSNLVDMVQRDYRVVFAGPTTLWSILNSLQMGFRTLAIEKRSSEVWNTLAAVKTEWFKYGEALDKVKKKLEEASNSIDQAQVRTRAVGRKLKEVQELPSSQADNILDLEDTLPQ